MDIKRSKLIRVLSEYFPEEDDSLFQDIADELEEPDQSSGSDIALFNKLLTYYRRRILKHRYVNLNAEHNYPYVASFIEDVNLFCKEFNLERREGYLEFIKTLFTVMGKSYRISYIRNKVETVFEKYEAIKLIKDNPHKDVAEEIMRLYIFKTVRMSGTKPVITLEDQQNFVKPSKYCFDNHIPADVMVDAVFDTLAWKNAIPSTSAFSNDKFLSRVPDYMAKNDLSTNNNVLTLNLKKLKDLRDD